MKFKGKKTLKKRIKITKTGKLLRGDKPVSKANRRIRRLI